MKLKDYWPRCLQDLVEFQQIANAEQPEFETALDDVRTAADDFFLATLSEYGCQRWEAIMGLHAADGDTLEARRERILIKYLDQLPYTYRTLLKYLKTITDDFTDMSRNELRRNGYAVLPGDLGEAVTLFEESELMKEVLGERLHKFIVDNKREEWREYQAQVTQWEIDRNFPIL